MFTSCPRKVEFVYLPSSFTLSAFLFCFVLACILQMIKPYSAPWAASCYILG